MAMSDGGRDTAIDANFYLVAIQGLWTQVLPQERCERLVSFNYNYYTGNNNK